MMAPFRMTVGLTVVAVCLGLFAPEARADTPGETDAEFFMSLSYKRVAMVDDGYRAVAILARGKDDLKEPGKCRDFLLERKIALQKWGLAPDEPLTKGKLAYMVCQALGIKGGVTMRLFGPSQRYCLFECEYLELMTGGAPYEHVTGGELVSTIDRADQHKLAEEAEAAKKAAAQAEGQQKAAGDKGNEQTSSNVKKAETTEGKATATDTKKSSEKAKETAAKGSGSPKAENTSDDASKPKPEKGQASPPEKPVQ